MSQARERFLSFMLQPVRDLDELQAGERAFLAEEIQHFLPTLQEPDPALRELTPLLNRIDGFRAAMLALLCGVLVERGGNPGIPIHSVIDLLRTQLKQVNAYIEQRGEQSDEDLFQHFPEEMRAHYGLQFTLLAAMTMLSRDKTTRKRWQRGELLTLTKSLEEHYEQLYYLKTALTLLDDQELLVLDYVNKRGFLVRLEGVQDRMYHCYALLQHAILEHTGPGYLKARPTDPEAVRYAQNQGMTPELYTKVDKLGDEQRFSFFHPGALRPDYTIDLVNPHNIMPGSASFWEVPALDGMPILLIGEKLMTFAWQPANMYPIVHEALSSKVEILRDLPLEEVENWLKRILQAIH